MNRVKEICIRKGITPKELAIMVGVSQPTVSDWFNNKKNPSKKRLEKLSEVLQVSRSVILGFDELHNDSGNKTAPADIRAEAKQLLDSFNDEKYQAALQYLKFLQSQNK